MLSFNKWLEWDYKDDPNQMEPAHSFEDIVSQPRAMIRDLYDRVRSTQPTYWQSDERLIQKDLYGLLQRAQAIQKVIMGATHFTDERDRQQLVHELAQVVEDIVVKLSRAGKSPVFTNKFTQLLHSLSNPA